MPESDAPLIRLRGVRVHNLRNLDLDLARNRLIVVTGVSGSGKSSLAFDTLYAEGQRRYIETFSSYTRQFLEVLDKPDADRIEGLPPAIAVGQQQGARRSGRSTVASVTEIEDHLALLYARLGQVVCQTCGTIVRPADPAAVVAAIEALPEKTRYQIAFPVEVGPETDFDRLAASLREEGFLRARIDGQTRMLDDETLARPSGALDVIVDRLVRGTEDPGRRLDSIETAFGRGLGRCRLRTETGEQTFFRGWRCSTCGADYLEPEPGLFRPNHPRARARRAKGSAASAIWISIASSRTAQIAPRRCDCPLDDPRLSRPAR